MNKHLRIAFTGLLFSFSAITFAQGATSVKTSDTTTGAEAPLDRSKLSYSNKWRIKFDNEAKSDGTLVFRLVMKDTKVEPITVNILIKKGTNENNTADIVEDAMQKAFPRDFNVETDDGESVLVKLNAVEGSSNVSLLSNDVKSLKVKIKKE